MKKINLLKVILAVVLLLSCVCFTGCDLVKGAIGGIINSGGLDLGGGSSDCQHENYVGRQQAPTCTEDGADMRLCVNCGKVLEKTTIPALGHDYVDGVCSRCGKDENNDCEHTKVSDWIIDKEATCTQEGSRYKKCSDCGAVVDSDIIDFYEHNFEKGVCTRCGINIENCEHISHYGEACLIYDAKCIQDGLCEDFCPVCNKSLGIKVIPAYGHNYVNGVCTRCGLPE